MYTCKNKLMKLLNLRGFLKLKIGRLQYIHFLRMNYNWMLSDI